MNAWLAAAIFVTSGVVWNLIRLPHRIRARRTPVAASRRGIAEYLLMGITVVASWLGFLHAFATLRAPADWFPLYGDYRFIPALGWIGTVAAGAAMALFFATHRVLGREWSVSLETRVGHRLVTAGIYRRIRHPMYLAFFLWFLAQALLIPNWIAGPGGLAAFALLYAMRVGREEAMMLDEFGQPYRDYMRRTGRLLPRGASAEGG